MVREVILQKRIVDEFFRRSLYRLLKLNLQSRSQTAIDPARPSSLDAAQAQVGLERSSGAFQRSDGSLELDVPYGVGGL